MSTISVDVTGLSGRVSLELPEDASLADVREAGNISPDLGLSVNGESVAADAEASTPAPLSAPVVSAPPEVKQGR